MSVQDGWIEVKTNKRGRKQFLLRYWVRDNSKLTGWRKASEVLAGCQTRKDATRSRQRRMKAVNEANAATASIESSVPVTFGDFVERQWSSYLRTKGRKTSTVYGYESLLRSCILPRFGALKLTDIRPTDISVFLDELATSKKGGNGPKALNVYSLLRTMFEVALEMDLVTANPVRKKLHRPKYKPKKKPTLSAEEVRRVVHQVPEVWKPIIVTVALTTLRIGEILALKWSDVDWASRKISVSRSAYRGVIQESTKTDIDLKKHMPDAVVSILRDHWGRSAFIGDEDFIFCREDGTSCDPGWLRKTILYPAIDRAGIMRGKRTHGFHIFRHTGATIIRSLTGDMKLAQIQMGHSRMETTADVYVQTDDSDVKRASDVLADAIGLDLPTSLPTN